MNRRDILKTEKAVAAILYRGHRDAIKTRAVAFIVNSGIIAAIDAAKYFNIPLRTIYSTGKEISKIIPKAGRAKRFKCKKCGHKEFSLSGCKRCEKHAAAEKAKRLKAADRAIEMISAASKLQSL